ncbi:acyl carrier protein [Streptomyces sp. NPDC058157]|uniref:acyl carrier protein n=1 Tax=Streptomyces sp. NPDC058157 TaxID=3346360 RepID=UPI0036F05546
MPDTARTPRTALDEAARDQLALALVPEVPAEEIDPDADMVAAYGLTSLNKVLFLTEVCEETGVDLAHFTEHDLADMKTLRDVTAALARHHHATATAATTPGA